MPSIIKKRSYYDYHEMEGEGIASAYDAIVNVPIDITKHLVNMGINKIGNIIKDKFTAEQYEGERHAREGLTGRPYNFAGPFTNLSKRIDRISHLPKEHSQPINSIDAAALRHDLQYENIGNDYFKNPTPENKKRQLKRIHDEDDIFINDVKRNRAEDPKVADIASNLIRLKKLGEQTGLLDSRKFSGFGKKPRINIVDEASDPVHRLRQLAIKQNKKYEPKQQQGGFAIPAFLIPILASAASTLVGKVYDTIKQKIEGKGYKIPHHKTIKQKKQFLMKIAKHIY